MSEIKLNKATFKGKTRYFESISKSMKESSDMWQYELNGDELVTLKDGREGTLGGLIYDEDNTFIGYEFSENPYGGYNYEEIKPEDIEKVSDIYADEDLMEALNEISDDLAIKTNKQRHTNLDKARKDYMQKAFDFDNPERHELQRKSVEASHKAIKSDKLYKNRRFKQEFGNTDNLIDYIQDEKSHTKLKNRTELEQKQGRPAYNVRLGKLENLNKDLADVINEVSRESANKVVKRRADQQYDAIQNYDINKPDTVDALHKAEDKLDRALNLRRNSAKLRKDESKINEGVLGAKVVKDTLEDIEFIVEFDDADETTYQVECYLVGDDTDTYSIRVYDNLHSEVNPYNDNEVMHGLFDSDGGSFDGMEVEIGENDPNFDRMGELEDFILDIIFNDRNGLMTKYQGEHSERLAESKMNEELSYEEYEKIAKKFQCPKSPKAAAKNCVAFLKYVNSNDLADELLDSRIFDSFFENGESIFNACCEAIIEECKYSSDFRFFVTVVAKPYMPVKNVLQKLEEIMNESKINEAIDNTIKIFLTNLGKYNEGDLVGEWVELPVDDWQPIFDRIGINDEYEEWFITDYEAPFRINEYDNIDELNDIAEKMQGFTDIQVEVLETCIDDAGYEMRDAIEKVADYDFFYVAGGTQEDLAYNYIAEIGSLEDAVNKDTIARYFDYEAFGRDLVLGGSYYRVDNVVNLDSLYDRDTAENIFGEEGEEMPSDENIETFKKWIEIYNNYDESQEEELAKQGIEVFMGSIYVDGVAYDVTTLEEIVDEDYELQSGFSDGEYVVDVLDETELAEYVIDNIYGDINELGDETLATYFDYDSYGRDLAYDFYKTENGWVNIN